MSHTDANTPKLYIYILFSFFVIEQANERTNGRNWLLLSFSCVCHSKTEISRRKNVKLFFFLKKKSESHKTVFNFLCALQNLCVFVISRTGSAVFGDRSDITFVSLNYNFRNDTSVYCFGPIAQSVVDKMCESFMFVSVVEDKLQYEQ